MKKEDGVLQVGPRSNQVLNPRIKLEGGVKQVVLLLKLRIKLGDGVVQVGTANQMPNRRVKLEDGVMKVVPKLNPRIKVGVGVM